jgi:cytoskeletal protein CcmA (bactofilin family)
MRFPYRPASVTGSVIVLLLASAGTALAAETASSEIVVIRENDTVAEDLYATGVRILIEGTVDGDLVAFAAEEVVISGEVTGSVLAVAPTVTIHGDVGGSARISGGNLTVSGSVGVDLVAAALSVDLDQDSVVGGDVLVWAVELRSGGTIGANLEGSQRSLELAGTVEGDVEVTVNRLVVTGPLRVIGDMGYRSPSEADGLAEASVGGVVARKTPVPPNIRVRALGLLARVLVVLALTSTALLVAWGWPKRTRLAAERARVRTWRAFGYGAVVVLSPLLLAGVAAVVAGLAPAAAGLPLLAIFGPLVMATAGVVLVLALVAGVPVVLAVGRALPRELGLFGAVLAGSVLAGVLWLIPIVGWIVPLLVLPVGVGAWLLSFRESQEGETA